jgi:RimJ/RimL family protein N-acetyltransferase
MEYGMDAERAVPTELDLSGDGLHLRPWRESDANSLYAAMRESQESIGRWLSWCHPAYDLRDAMAWIVHCRNTWRLGEQYAFAVFAPDGQLLGSVDIKLHDRRIRCGNVGYWMRQSRQRLGVCPRALALLAGFGFGVLDLQRLEILAATGNLPSRRVAEKLGARFEGIARQRLVVHGQPSDAAVYALIPTDLGQSTDAQNAATSS